MLIPICGERLPVKLSVRVVSARGLPVMNKGINNTEAFVEVRYKDENSKTDVVTSLDPTWNSDPVVFETDERELCEDTLEFRVMDHDTYSANDAIGRVEVDVNNVAEAMRMRKEEEREEQIVMPIWDTIHGIRGQLMFSLKVTLMVPADYTYYVQFYSSDKIPPEFALCEIVGLVGTMRYEKDPEQQWIDRIRTPRASNDARQTEMRAEMRLAAIEIAEKAHKADAQMVIGYREMIDIEGAPTNNFCLRAYGTAVVVLPTRAGILLSPRLSFPIISMGWLPSEWTWGSGPLVSSRTALILEEVDNLDALRKRAWTDLRHEIFQQAQSMGCNIVYGYREELAIHEGIALLSCFGSAARFGPVEEVEKMDCDVYNHNKPHPDTSSSVCALYHAAVDPSCVPFDVKLHPCNWCKNELCGDLVLSTGEVPDASLIIGAKNYIQVSMAKKLITEEDDAEDLATRLNTVLPSIDKDLFNLLLTEGRAVNAQGNGFFEVRSTTILTDGILVCALTGILARLACFQKEDSSGPSLPPVLSFSSLQRHNDSRRFSWGTVREAMRMRPNQTPAITLKILHLKRGVMNSPDEGNRKTSKLNSLVGRIRRPKFDKDYISHCVLERLLSACIGVIESGVATNAANMAGVHLGMPLISLVLNREQAADHTILGRWRQIYIKEDNSGNVRDSAATDAFLSTALDECLAMARGALSASSASALTNFSLPSAHFTANKDQAQIILVLAGDLCRPTVKS
ncbi:hypothetical protein PMAYCL1PPCAC_30638 [Pristionchus mayeri]|uniref:C2 domain-containing protein n=1 Tax=Pristionchus mayeri TaxID=1317129 RepID=A0AAN5DC61_9BILA|nr:hypothetical protein PMAYCL1PPCAC_30638 [Pristionchus mayeri]